MSLPSLRQQASVAEPVNGYPVACSRRMHYLVLAVLIAVVFTFQLWMNHQKRCVRWGGLDYPNFLTLGRGLAELRTLPTFRWPGKTFGSTLKSFAAFFPCVFFGYHESIPLVMISIYGTLICCVCYLIARVSVSKSAGLIALTLCAASDPYMATYAMKHAYGFDVTMLLGLSLAALAVVWAKQYRLNDRQPGVMFCLIMGIVAGLLWYTHPTSIASIAAAACFLLLALGIKIFTWRVPVVALGTLLGGMRFWIYWARNPSMLASWQSFSDRYERTTRFVDFLFSRDGYSWFLLSPSGKSLMRLFLGISLLIVTCMFLLRVVHALLGLKKSALREYLRTGFPMPVSTYGFFVAASTCAIIFKTAGMAQASAGWIYGVQLWFWLIIAGAFAVDRLLRLARPVGVIVLTVLCFFFFRATVRGLPGRHESTVRRWNEIKSDAADLVALGHSTILSGHPRYYMYFAIGPSGLVLSQRYTPWIRKAAEIVEQSTSPALISALTPATLGTQTWETTELRTTEVYHSFRMPTPGTIIPNDSWTVLVNDKPSQHAEFLRDDSMSTTWMESRDSHSDTGLVFTIVFDRPRSICRVCMFLERGAGDWIHDTYPRQLRITGKRSSGEWVLLTEGAEPDGYFWDGGRLFHAERERKPFDIRFRGETIVRLQIEDKGRALDWRERKITELYLFETPSHALPGAGLDVVLDRVRSSGASRVLAGRFISAQIRKAYPETGVWLPPFLRQRRLPPAHAAPWPWSPALEPVPGDATLIISDIAFLPRTERILREENIRFRSERFGLWAVCEIVSPLPPEQSLLVWNGLCLGRYPHKRAADYHLQKGKALLGEERMPEAMFHLQQALALYPHLHEAGRLIESAQGGSGPATNLWKQYAPPAEVFPAPLRFANEARLLGIEISPRTIRRGKDANIRYYWEIPHHWEGVLRRPTVFCHFVKDAHMISDDHLLLANYRSDHVREVVFPEIFVEPRALRIPEDAPPGNYALEVGLHHRLQRVAVRSRDRTAKIRRNAAWLPGITVEP